MPTPLLTTKLYIPQRPAEFLSRPRLLDLLNQGLDQKLTIISAPAGFGKTTLASDWVANLPEGANVALKPKPAWLVLDDGDNDLSRFLTYLVAALQQIEPQLGRNTMEALQSGTQPNIPLLLTTLINEIVQCCPDKNAETNQAKYILILDDYHVITTGLIHEAVMFLLDNMPPQLRLIITSRADPPLSLGRLRARRHLVEIRENDLRFTVAEVTDLLNQVMRLNLSARDVEALEARTEGWIAGLQLAAISLQGRTDVGQFIDAFTGSHQFILDYLAEEVIDQQPTEVQQFLLQTAILNRFNAELCDAVTERDDSQVMLEYLARANIFIISLDDHRHWFRYHQLFVDLLRHYIKQAPTAFHPALIEEIKETGVKTLHQRAASWYNNSDLIEEAVYHAQAAGDFAFVLEIIDQNFREMFSQRKTNLLLNWFQSIPAPLLEKTPRLHMVWAWTHFITGDLRAAERKLRQVEHTILVNDGLGLPPDLVAQVKVLQAELALANGRTSEAIELYQQALANFPAGEVEFRYFTRLNLAKAYRLNGEVQRSNQLFSTTEALPVDDEFTAVVQMLFVSEQHQFHGRLQQSIVINQQILSLLQEQTTPHFIGFKMNAQIRLSEVFFEQNQIETAHRYATSALELARETSDRRVMITSLVMLARIHQVLEKPDQADAFMKQAVQHSQDSNIKSMMNWVESWQACLWLAQNKLAEATHWANVKSMAADDQFDGQMVFEYLTLARLLITQQQNDQAQSLLDRLIELAQTLEQCQYVVEALILQAVILNAQNELNLSISVIEKAMLFAEPEGYLQCFINDSEAMVPLLSHFVSCYQQQSTYQPHILAYTEQVLSLLPVASSEESIDVAPSLELLTKRELEVLQLIAEGLSNRKIAEKLVVAESTLKTHAKNIYGKLGVNSRVQALAKAKELNILS